MKRPTKPTASAKNAAFYGYSDDGKDELLYDWIRRPTARNGSPLRHQAANQPDWSPDKEPKMTTETPAPSHVPTDSAHALVDELTELRARFDQIEKLAAEGQELLTGLAPRLAELSAMVSDVEAVLHKWKREG